MEHLKSSKQPVNFPFLILLIFGSIIFGFFLVKAKILPLEGGKDKITPSASVSAKKATLALKTADNNTIITSSQETIPLLVVADSDSEPINQFNIVVSYDKNTTQLENYKPLLADFDYAVQKEDGKIKVSGTKKLSASQPAIFKETQLAQLTFKKAEGVTSSGSATFSFNILTSPSGGSKLVDAKNLNMEVSASGVKLSQGTKITLVKNQAATLSDTGITLTLLATTMSDDKCRDCITYAKVKVAKDGQEQQLEYKIGGIAGFMVNKLDAFNYTFQLEKINPDTVELTYLPKQ